MLTPKLIKVIFYLSLLILESKPAKRQNFSSNARNLDVIDEQNNEIDTTDCEEIRNSESINSGDDEENKDKGEKSEEISNPEFINSGDDEESKDQYKLEDWYKIEKEHKFTRFNEDKQIEKLLDTFREKIKSNLISKPDQHINSFLNNIENLMQHHLSKYI